MCVCMCVQIDATTQTIWVVPVIRRPPVARHSFGRHPSSVGWLMRSAQCCIEAIGLPSLASVHTPIHLSIHTSVHNTARCPVHMTRHSIRRPLYPSPAFPPFLSFPYYFRNGFRILPRYLPGIGISDNFGSAVPCRLFPSGRKAIAPTKDLLPFAFLALPLLFLHPSLSWHMLGTVYFPKGF